MADGLKFSADLQKQRQPGWVGWLVWSVGLVCLGDWLVWLVGLIWCGGLVWLVGMVG